jgi:hypothetical protein
VAAGSSTRTARRAKTTGESGVDRSWETRSNNVSEPTDVWKLVLTDMERRRQIGLDRYGKTVLADDVGEDWLQHHYEELLDAVVYIRAEIERRKAVMR